ncbi:DUF6300 family protein [Streptomyces sp. NPDC093071]|uniref:DUF6300 family protein n=1 Tax=Streptomyces sp. NPDC093071 TaxID=3366022 RepID=UPI00380D0285
MSAVVPEDDEDGRPVRLELCAVCDTGDADRPAAGLLVQWFTDGGGKDAGRAPGRGAPAEGVDQGVRGRPRSAPAGDPARTGLSSRARPESRPRKRAVGADAKHRPASIDRLPATPVHLRHGVPPDGRPAGSASTVPRSPG